MPTGIILVTPNFKYEVIEITDKVAQPLHFTMIKFKNLCTQKLML